MSALLPLMYAPQGPLIRSTPFLQYHMDATRRMIGREPSAFMRATAHSLWQTFQMRMPTEGQPVAYAAVSAATGSGKSLAACALLAFLAEESEHYSGAYVVETIEAVEEVRQWLERLAPGKVAAYSSIHHAKASATSRTARDYAERGVIAGAQYSEEQFKAARIVVTTHARWKRDLEGADGGVLRCNGRDRTLVIVDEEPNLQVSYTRQPEHVSALLSVLSDHVQNDEARAFGFTTAHQAAAALRAIHDRMRAVKDNLTQPQIVGADLVTAEDAAALAAVTREDISRCLWGKDSASVAFHAETLDFLKAAAQGRVFYSKDEGGAFYAYAFRLPVKARHIVLDGTADLNGIYAVGGHVSTAPTPRPNYRNLELFAVTPPVEFRGQMRARGMLRDIYRLTPYMAWLFEFIEQQTKPGERVLIYAKQALLSFGIHNRPEYDDSGANDRNQTTFKGRELHWCNFGRGRGINKWKDCNVYIRLGDFHLKRATAVQTVGSLTNRKFNASELRHLSSPSAKDEDVTMVQEGHLIVTNKQDAARTIIRQLDDTGVCPAARAYMVDCDLALLVKHQAAMFPMANPYRVIDANGNTLSASRTEGGGAAARVSRFLLMTDQTQVSVPDLVEQCGMPVQHCAHTLNTREVREAMAARGWTESTRKAQGLPGKGRLLIRAAA
ncbi:MAG: DEAD/DEAH box helicase family protein [Chloroflexota bacterium]|nr:DEAD/DEAH box helicase family protein [Chloroflexota bacterium]